MADQATPASAAARTPAVGSGRRGHWRSAGKSSTKRGRTASAAKAAIDRISDGSLKRLARRAGVKRIGKGVLDSRVGIRRALLDFLGEVLKDAAVVVDYSRRFTVTGNDIALVLKRRGRTLYMQGCDWTYGSYYTRERVRKAVASRPPTPGQLQRAAQSRLSALSAAEPACEEEGEVVQQLVLQQAGEAVGQAAEGRAAEEAGTSALLQQEQESQHATSAGKDAALADGEAAAAAAEGEAPFLEEEEQEQEEEQQAAPPMDLGAAEESVEHEEQQVHVLAPEAAAAPQTAAKAATIAGTADGRRASISVRTPAPLSVDRARAIQAVLAEVMHSQLCAGGSCSQARLLAEMPKRMSCTADEVKDVLFVLEERDAIMMDGDSIYLC